MSTTTWKFYADAGLTSDVSAGIPVAQVASGGATDLLVYFGSTASGATLQAASSPGGDPITITPADSASGSGVETSMIRLASTALGLDSATPGAAMSLGVSLSSGASNAVPVWVRVAAGALAVGSYTDGGLELCAVVES